MCNGHIKVNFGTQSKILWWRPRVCLIWSCKRLNKEWVCETCHFSVRKPNFTFFGVTTFSPNRGELNQVTQSEQLERWRNDMKICHDMKSLKEESHYLYKGQHIRILDKVSKIWCPVKVLTKELSPRPRSYLNETPNGTFVRRNKSLFREIPITKPPIDINITTETFADAETHSAYNNMNQDSMEIT